MGELNGPGRYKLEWKKKIFPVDEACMAIFHTSAGFQWRYKLWQLCSFDSSVPLTALFLWQLCSLTALFPWQLCSFDSSVPLTALFLWQLCSLTGDLISASASPMCLLIWCYSVHLALMFYHVSLMLYRVALVLKRLACMLSCVTLHGPGPTLVVTP